MSKEKVMQIEQNRELPIQPQAAETKPQKLIYVGPSLSGLKSLTIFKGGIPKEGQDLIARDEKYKRLFVPVANLGKAIKDIKDGGLGEIYKSAKEG